MDKISWNFVCILLGVLSMFGSCKSNTRSHIMERSRRVWPREYRTFLFHRPINSYHPNVFNAIYLYKTPSPYMGANAMQMHRMKRYPYGNLMVYDEKRRSPHRMKKEMSTSPSLFNSLTSKFMSNSYIPYNANSAAILPLIKSTLSTKQYLQITPTTSGPLTSENCVRDQYNIEKILSGQKCGERATLQYTHEQRNQENYGDLIHEPSENIYPHDTVAPKNKINEIRNTLTPPTFKYLSTPFINHSTHSFFTLDDVFIPPVYNSYKPREEPAIKEKFNLGVVYPTFQLWPKKSVTSTVRSYYADEDNFFRLPTIAIRTTPAATQAVSVSIPIATSISTTTTLAPKVFSNSIDFSLFTEKFVQDEINTTPKSDILHYSTPTIGIFQNFKPTQLTTQQTNCFFCYNTTHDPSAVDNTTIVPPKANIGHQFRTKLRKKRIRTYSPLTQTINNDRNATRKNTTETVNPKRTFNRSWKNPRSDFLKRKKNNYLSTTTMTIIKKVEDLNITRPKYFKKRSFFSKNLKQKITENQLNETRSSTESSHPTPPTTKQISFITTTQNLSPKEVKNKTEEIGSKDQLKKFNFRKSYNESRNSIEKSRNNVSTTTPPNSTTKKNMSTVESAIMTISSNANRTILKSRNAKHSTATHHPSVKGRNVPIITSITEVPPLPIEVYFRKTKNN